MLRGGGSGRLEAGIRGGAWVCWSWGGQGIGEAGLFWPVLVGSDLSGQALVGWVLICPVDWVLICPVGGAWQWPRAELQQLRALFREKFPYITLF